MVLSQSDEIMFLSVLCLFDSAKRELSAKSIAFTHTTSFPCRSLRKLECEQVYGDF